MSDTPKSEATTRVAAIEGSTTMYVEKFFYDELVIAINELRAKHERVLQALKEASKRSTYKWTDGYDYFPSDHANEGRIALANELITIIEVHNESLEK